MADIKQNDLAHEITQEMDQDQLEKIMEDDVVIDIEKSIQDTKHEAGPCINRVPPEFRNPREAYTPMAVSIGPFHYGDERLQDMEEQKHVLFKRFTQRAKASWIEMVSFVKNLEPKIRASYLEDIKLSKEEFVKLVLVDAAFIIEFFRSMFLGEIHNDRLSQPFLLRIISKDLLLLENQLPFFLIENLYSMASPHGQFGDLPSFLHLTYSFFEKNNVQKLEPSPNVRIKHFTDLLRLFYLPIKPPARRVFFEDEALLKYSANELQKAGVKFKASRSKCLLELEFSGRVFEIPQIFVDDNTEILLRNMIVLEQCHYPFECYFTDYVVLLNRLIQTSKDADLLIQKTIVRSDMADCTGSGVARLFSDLQRSIVFGSYSSKYIGICRALNEFNVVPWYKSKADLLLIRLNRDFYSLKRDYCSTPWKTLATLGAILLLILTLIQTIFTILK